MRVLARLSVVAALAALAFAALPTRPASASGSYLNLQLSSPSNWLLYTEGPSGYWINVTHGQVTDTTVPSGVGSTCFNFNISSSSSYANAYYYQNLAQVTSNSFEYTLWYKFTSSGQIAQAYEFPLNKYTGGKRYQLAMQYVPNSDGNGYRWRVWGGANSGYGWTDTNPSTGHSWGFTQNLAANQWHSIALYGNFTGGTVNYTDFYSDGTHFAINHSFSPDTGSGERIVPAYQVDNNYTGNSQDVHVSNWSVYWF